MKILSKDVQFKISLNPKVTSEQIDGEGYFYNEELDRIIIMNSTCLFLWNYIINSKSEVVSVDQIANEFKNNYILSDEDHKNLIFDIVKTINDMLELGILNCDE